MTQGDDSQRAFGAVVVYLQPAVVDVTCECAPAGERIAYRRRALALSRQPPDGVLHPLVQLVDQWLGTRLTNLASKLGKLAANLFLNGIERSDPGQSFACCGRGMDGVDLIQLAAGMGPAGHLIDALIAIEMVEACIRVSLQRTSEVLQMMARMLALAILRVGEPDGRWCLVAGRAVIPDIRP